MKRTIIAAHFSLTVLLLSAMACNKGGDDQLPANSNQSHWVVVSAGQDGRNAHKDWAVHWRKLSLQNRGTGKQYNTTVWTFEPEAKSFTTLAPSQTVTLEPDDYGDAWYVRTPAGQSDWWGAVILRKDDGSDRDFPAYGAIAHEGKDRRNAAIEATTKEAIAKRTVAEEGLDCGYGLRANTSVDSEKLNLLMRCPYGFTVSATCTITCKDKPVDVRVVQ